MKETSQRVGRSTDAALRRPFVLHIHLVAGRWQASGMGTFSRRSALVGLASSAVALAACSGEEEQPETPGADETTPEGQATGAAEPEAPSHQVVAREQIDAVVLPLEDASPIDVSRAVLEMATAVVVARAAVAADDAATPAPGAEPDTTEQSPDQPTSPEASPAVSVSPEPDASPEGSVSPDQSPSPQSPDHVAAGVAEAERLGIPILLDGPGLVEELDRLGTRTVIAFPPDGLDVGDREVLAGGQDPDPEGLPLTAEPVDAIALRVAGDEIPVTTAATLAAAGVDVMDVDHADPRASAESVALVKDAAGVLALGAFGDNERFASRLEDARTLPELPGGGVAPFPGRMMIALYGHPGAPVLGVLGEQGPEEAAALAKQYAEEYQVISDKPVIGCFEIITTIASSSAGSDGNYSILSSMERIMPFVDAAEEHGLYVVLDLQPGMTDFLTQAQRYEEVLKRPHVGLALDPEWRLQPGQRHMTIIGQVHIDEVNATGAWLADLVRQNNLPPKVLVLHQFQTRMIIERERLDTSRDEVQYLMHADGHGNHGMKLETWRVLRQGLPGDVHLGWKNFIDEDSPMMTVEQTMTMVEPTPDFVSYQ